MIVSEARLAANRRNAAKSTGPKTAAGKDRSRANALKHGLCASELVPENPAQVQARAEACFHSLKPQNKFAVWLTDQAAITTLRIDRAVRIERRLRDKASLRAELCWDDDRRAEAEALGAALHGQPGPVLVKLHATPHGCDWLLTRWALLAHAAESTGTWTAEQRSLAFDLLGTPTEFRAGDPGRSIGLDGRDDGPVLSPAALARREIGDLEIHRALVAELDEVDQALAAADLVDDSTPEFRRLRRYEASLHRRLRWCLAEIKYESPHHFARQDLPRPNYAVLPEPEYELIDEHGNVVVEPPPPPEPVAQKPPVAEPPATVPPAPSLPAVAPSSNPEQEEKVNDDDAHAESTFTLPGRRLHPIPRRRSESKARELELLPA